MFTDKLDIILEFFNLFSDNLYILENIKKNEYRKNTLCN